MFEQLQKYLALLLITLLVVAGIWGYFKVNAYENELADLRNQAAQKDQTYEILKGKYTKLAEEHENLKSSDAELQKIFTKTKQDLIAETNLTIFWKGKYKYEVDHRPVPPDPTDPLPPVTPVACTENVQKYEGVKDIGLLKLTIFTFTKDPSYQTQLQVEKGSTPLKLTVDLTRDRKEQWHTTVVSGDEKIGVDIGVNKVNIEPLESRWYEHLKVHFDIGAGLDQGGILGGAGVAYQFGKIDMGPSIWAETKSGHSWAGLNFSWAPLKAK